MRTSRKKLFSSTSYCFWLFLLNMVMDPVTWTEQVILLILNTQGSRGSQDLAGYQEIMEASCKILRQTSYLATFVPNWSTAVWLETQAGVVKMIHHGSSKIIQEQKVRFLKRWQSSTSVRNNGGITEAPQITSLTLTVTVKTDIWKTAFNMVVFCWS